MMPLIAVTPSTPIGAIDRIGHRRTCARGEAGDPAALQGRADAKHADRPDRRRDGKADDGAFQEQPEVRKPDINHQLVPRSRSVDRAGFLGGRERDDGMGALNAGRAT